MHDPGIDTDDGTGSGVADGGVAVIVPVYNAASFLPDLLHRLVEEHREESFSLVLSDNGSTDGSWPIIEAHASEHDHVVAVQSTKLQCAAHARNVGADATDAELLLFCDADDLPAPGWVATMRDALRHAPFVGGSLEYERLNSPEQLAARNLVLRDQPVMKFGCPFASGANFGCRRWVWRELGGQDTSMPPGSEDADFSIRACRELDVPAHYVPEAAVSYRLRTGHRHSFRQSRNYGFNEVAVYRRHGSHPLATRCRSAAYRYFQVLRHVPLVLTASGRRILTWRIGKLVGRLQGSVRYRVFYA